MRLYILQYALNPETGSPVPGYLIQTDDGTNVLVDTGFPHGRAGEERQTEEGERQATQHAV